ELTEAGSVLMPSEHPVLIVEGVTDVAAAIDIGLVAIGRPSSSGCLDKLTNLIAGRNVLVLGENDAGAGVEGMEKAFEILRPYAKHIAKILPPDGIKDLRQWVSQGITQDVFIKLIRTKGSSIHEDNILVSVAPLDLAKQWLEANYYQDDIYTLRMFHGSWYAYNGECYKEIDAATLRQQLYRFFGKKQYKKIHAKGFDILNYDPTKQKLDQIVDALLAFCPITANEIPCWLDDNHTIDDPKRILLFPNGYLNINNENLALRESTPHFFSLACYPY
ncbi:unnamed protein product, partial [marine sediment metagenome]